MELMLWALQFHPPHPKNNHHYHWTLYGNLYLLLILAFALILENGNYLYLSFSYSCYQYLIFLNEVIWKELN